MAKKDDRGGEGRAPIEKKEIFTVLVIFSLFILKTTIQAGLIKSFPYKLKHLVPSISSSTTIVLLFE